MPTDYNRRDRYTSFAELGAPCEALSAMRNSRPHSLTRRVPAEMLEVRRQHLPTVPDAPFTAAFGESSTLGWSATAVISVWENVDRPAAAEHLEQALAVAEDVGSL
jgi:hypothetical protein